MTTTFEHAEVGDRVWSLKNGWGTIVSIKPESEYPIRVQHDVRDFGNTAAFTFSGEFIIGDLTEDLYWGEIKITPPPMPKRVKYKNVNGFKVPTVNIDFSAFPESIYIRVPRLDAEPSSGLICLESNSKKLRRLIENGVAYPDTKEGRKAAAAHARALLGEGEPWEE